MSQGYHNAFGVSAANPAGENQPIRLTWVEHTERSSTGVVSIAPGGGLAPHIHESHDEIITVAQGEVEFRFGGESRRVSAGEVITVPAGTIHAPTLSQGGCVLVSVFAPWFDPENPDRLLVDD